MKNIILKIKSFFKKIVEDLDSKTNPRTGNILYKVFRNISFILIFVGIPSINIGFGIWASGPFPGAGGYNTLPMTIIGWTFFPILFTSLISWFWFKKFKEEQSI